MHHLLQDIGLSIIAATLVGILTYKLRQPTILGYLLAGALIGPGVGLRLVTDPISIEIISEIGLILLLFIIGLEMNPRGILESGRQLLITGVGQFVLCVLLGLATFHVFGPSGDGENLQSLYLSLLCALSSTAIVVKLLYDKFELDTRPGRMTVGVLVIQDLWAILILAFQPNFSKPELILIGNALLKSAILVGVGFFFSKYLLKNVFEWIAKSPEMVVATSIGWCASLAYAAGAMGLSKEMGALIAGISIATFPYSIHVTAKTLPLRDFFLTLFFISLGLKIVLPEMGVLIGALGILVFVILSRFLSIYPLLILSGTGRRTSFITSLNLSQISEFSLVIASLGIGFGHLEQNFMAMMIYAMAFTSVLSSYLIKYNHPLFLLFDRLLNRLGFSASLEEEEAREEKRHPLVLLGFHHGARAFVEVLSQQSPHLLHKILVVDFNLEVLKGLRKMNIAGVFGDINSLDTLEHVHLKEAEIILSTIPDMLLKGTDNLTIVRKCRALAPNAVIVATADSTEQVQKLKALGATEVLLPYTMAGEFLAHFVEARLGVS